MHKRGPPARQPLQEPEQRLRRRAPRGLELDDDELLLGARLEPLEVDPERDDPVVAVEALGGGFRGPDRRREQPVHPRPEAVAAGAPGGVDQAVDREERRRGQGLGRGEREVRDAREPWLEAVDDVVVAAGEREAEVRAHGHRHAQVRSSRERDRRADRYDRGFVAALQGLPPGHEIARARRRSQDGHLVAAPAQRFRGSRDVAVHLVRLRPGERRHETDPKAHFSQVTS